VRVLVVEDEPWNIRRLAVEVTSTSPSVPIEELVEGVRSKGVEENRRYVTGIVKKFGHNIVLEFGRRALILDGVSRFTALYIWRMINIHNQIYGAGLETSLRLVKPPFRCIDEHSERIYKRAEPLYLELVEKGVPTQDARYVLPEGVQTRIIFNFDPGLERYWLKIVNGLLPKLEEHETIAEEICRHLGGHVQTFEEPPTVWRYEGLGPLPRHRGEYGPAFSGPMVAWAIDGSLSMYAQLVRQRLALVVLRPIRGIAESATFTVPPSFDSHQEEAYKEVAYKAAEEQERAEFVGYSLLLGQVAYADFYIYGPWAIEKMAEARSCGTAQWEIRTLIGVPLAREYDVPLRCERLGYCREPRRFECPIRHGFREMSREEKFRRLEVAHRRFKARGDP